MLHTTLAILLVGLVVLYAVLCPRLNLALYRPLLFHPVPFVDEVDSQAPELSGVSGENIFFESEDGKQLYGWYYARPQSKYTVLLSHGNGGNVSYRQDTVEMLVKTGASVFIYDYRGYGRCTGVPDVEGICVDAKSAYDYLNVQRGIPADRIILYGESLGCAVTNYLATQRQCSGIILQSGFASLSRIATEIFPLLVLYPGPLLSDPPLDNLSIVRGPHPPLLVVHGRQDETVPFAHAAAVFKAASEPKRFLELPRSGHCDLCSTAPDYSRAINDFFSWVSAHQALQHLPSGTVQD
jgi:fermentation-respiration switch protein FrsA (DUF1100 family)